MNKLEKKIKEENFRKNTLPKNYLALEKEEFVNKLSNIICNNNNFENLRYEAITNNKGEIIDEFVIITCTNGYKYKVNVVGDSCIAIMKDVSSVMLQHS